MRGGRLFLDTSYIQALFDRRDALHVNALAVRRWADAAAELWLTEAVLVEVGNALSTRNRNAASEFIETSYLDPHVRVVPVGRELLLKATGLYRSHADKTWGMTDCLSFVVMGENKLTDALTADRHFVQAGFRALMLETA